MKKGFQMNITVVISLILIIVFIVVSFSIFDVFKGGSRSVIDIGSCRASLEANARRVEIGDIDIIGPLVEVKCGGYDVVIKKEDEEEAKEILADLMTVGRNVNVRYVSNGKDKIVKQFVPGIWQTVDRGAKKYFERSLLDYKFCIPWAYVKSEGDLSVDGFFDYLFNTNIQNFDYTYGEYLSYDEDKISKGGVIDLSRNGYVMMFVQTNKGAWAKTLGLVAGGPIGYFVGASYATHDSTVVLIPNTEEGIQKLGCDVKK